MGRLTKLEISHHGHREQSELESAPSTVNTLIELRGCNMSQWVPLPPRMSSSSRRVLRLFTRVPLTLPSFVTVAASDSSDGRGPSTAPQTPSSSRTAALQSRSNKRVQSPIIISDDDEDRPAKTPRIGSASSPASARPRSSLSGAAPSRNASDQSSSSTQPARLRPKPRPKSSSNVSASVKGKPRSRATPNGVADSGVISLLDSDEETPPVVRYPVSFHKKSITFGSNVDLLPNLLQRNSMRNPTASKKFPDDAEMTYVPDSDDEEPLPKPATSAASAVPESRRPQPARTPSSGQAKPVQKLAQDLVSLDLTKTVVVSVNSSPPPAPATPPPPSASASPLKVAEMPLFHPEDPELDVHDPAVVDSLTNLMENMGSPSSQQRAPSDPLKSARSPSARTTRLPSHASDFGLPGSKASTRTKTSGFLVNTSSRTSSPSLRFPTPTRATNARASGSRPSPATIIKVSLDRSMAICGRSSSISRALLQNPIATHITQTVQSTALAPTAALTAPTSQGTVNAAAVNQAANLFQAPAASTMASSSTELNKVGVAGASSGRTFVVRDGSTGLSVGDVSF